MSTHLQNAVKPRVIVIAQFPFDILDGITGGRGVGQQSTWLAQLAMQWEHQQDYEIHWCVIGHNQSEARTEIRWNQTFHLLPSPSISVSMLLARWPQRVAFRRLFRKIKPDLIHCWGTESLYSACFHEFRGPSVLSMQGIVTVYFQTGDLKGWRWKLFSYWERPAIKRATVVTCESEWGMCQVNKIIPDKTMRKVEYGVHPSYYDVTWHPDPESPRILFVGSLNRLKGVDILLELLRSYPERNWTIVFLGDGYLADELRALNDPRVEVLGILKTSEVQAEMAKAWALVIPSRADTSPNVVKEARVIGLPVIGSPNGGHAEYINDAHDGYLVENENPDK